MSVHDTLPAESFEVVFGNLMLELVAELEAEGQPCWVAEQIVLKQARHQRWQEAALQVENELYLIYVNQRGHQP